MSGFLPPELLASASDITLPSLIDAQDRYAEAAREIMPYSFDSCTYTKGYLRQSIWSCLGAYKCNSELTERMRRERRMLRVFNLMPCW